MSSTPTHPPADGVGPRPMPFAFDLGRNMAEGRPVTVLRFRTFYGEQVFWLADDVSQALEDALRTVRGGLHVPPTNGTHL